MTIKIPIAVGELVDKLTILEIKLERIADPRKLENVKFEYDALTAVFREDVAASARLDELTAHLKAVNNRLWDIEDEIRELERQQNFGPEFVALARSVYRTNDARAATKRQINELFQSAIVEEKSYTPY